LLATASTILAAGAVHAAPLFEFDVIPSGSSGVPFPTAGGATGTFHVTITQLAVNTYQIEVTGNNDGNIKGANPNPDGPRDASGPSIPHSKGGVGQINLNFLDSTLAPIGPLTPTGNGATSTYVLGDLRNVGGNNNITHYGEAGSLAVVPSPPGDTINYTTPNKSEFIAPFGGNTFTGVFTAPAPLNVAGTTAQVLLQGDAQQWNGAQTLATPEPAALAMLSAGLLPFGLVLRRRRTLS